MAELLVGNNGTLRYGLPTTAIQATERSCKREGTLFMVKIYLLLVICSNEILDIPYFSIDNALVIYTKKF
jgi:hypothetical protein